MSAAPVPEQSQLTNGPLVNLLDSNPAQTLTQQQHRTPHSKSIGANRELRPLQHFDDSQVPPEPGVVSEQPEVSDVRQMRAELEMHRRNAKAGVGFVSQSGETYTAHGDAARERHRRAHKQRSLSARTALSKSGRKKHSRRNAITSTASQTSGSYTSDSRTRSGSSNTRTVAHDTLLSNAVQQSIRDDEKAGVVTDARRYVARNGNQTDQADKNAPQVSDKLEKAKNFVKGNLTLIITCVVLLALVGVTVYLMFKSNGDSAERDAERERERALAAQEERMRERDAVLQDLQTENAQLKTAYESNAEAIKQYEAHLNQYQAQTSAQIEALEALEAQNSEYERAMEEWQQFYSQLEQQYAEQNERALETSDASLQAPQFVAESEIDMSNASDYARQVKEERPVTPEQHLHQRVGQNFDEQSVRQQQQPQQQNQQQQQQQSPIDGNESPGRIPPPLENREQVPFGTLEEVQAKRQQ